MYLPKAFQETTPLRLHEFVRRHSFATLITLTSGPDGSPVPFASHLPFLLDERGGTLRGHLARANPQWQHFRPDQEVLAIFQGPHAFVSSNWYEDPANAVPTWNFTAVHVYGKPRVCEEGAETFKVLEDLVALYQPEGHPLSLSPPADRARELARAIVAFEIEITRWEGKFKLSQNRSASDQERVRRELLARGGVEDRAVAELMKP